MSRMANPLKLKEREWLAPRFAWMGEMIACLGIREYAREYANPLKLKDKVSGMAGMGKCPIRPSIIPD